LRIPLDRQRALYDAHSAAAVDALIELLRTRGDELVRLGIQRAFETVGVEEYGDSTFWLTRAQLGDELAAELADAVFYMSVALAHEAGELPVP
jgi:hypothetical protein